MMRKDLLMEKGMEFKVQRELRVLRTLRHPQLIKLFQVIETPTDIFMVCGDVIDHARTHTRVFPCTLS